jgi:murein L,D-transpeptidase YafK
MFRPAIDRANRPSLPARGHGTRRAIHGGMRSIVIGLALLLSLDAVTALSKEPARVIRVYKSERRMTYEEEGRVVRTFKISLGTSPVGDKRKQGDRKTPEGELYVTVKNPKSSFHRFIGLSYPMPVHAESALEAKAIDERTMSAIRRAAKKRQQPPQTTALGGYVGIHGGGVGGDWTWGCVAVEDEEIEWLYARLKQGDAIFIYP